MTILEEIIAHKYKEVASDQKREPTSELERQIEGRPSVISMKEALINKEDKLGIIAEFKRKSPSKGVFNESLQPEDVTKGYVESGASALSVLTDENYFGGKVEDLIKARVNQVPIIRKDFMVDEYQILKARAIGADVVLLIAAAIPADLVNRLAKFAKSIGMETLLEIHEQEELNGTLNDDIDMVGINNRNLKTFEVDYERSIRVFESLPAEMVRIAESGISKPEVFVRLQKVGFQGFLMGEAFMQTKDPIASIQEFTKKVKVLSESY